MLLREYIEKGLLPGKPEQQEPASCLFRQGERAEQFFFVWSGKVGLAEASDSDSAPIIAPANRLIGLTDLMNDTYSYTAIVLERSTLIRIRKEDLLRAIDQNPSLRLYLLKQMSLQNSLANTAYE